MERISASILILPALGLLAACGGGAAVTSGSGGVVGGSVAPVFATDPGPGLIGLDAKIDEALRDPARGATGFAVVYDQFSPNPQIRELKIRLSPDRETIHVTIPGVANDTLTAMDTPSNLGGTYGENPPLTVPLVSTLHSFNTGIFSYKLTEISGFTVDDTTALGVYGIETPYDRVPASASYTGDLAGFGIPTIGDSTINGVDGDITIILTGTAVSGTFTGSTTVNSNTFNDATGTMTGSLGNNVLSGSLSIASSGSSLDGTFAAKLYGWNAEDVAGVFEGTIRPTGGSAQQAYGTFEAD